MSKLHKPYPDMQTALEQWRSFDDPARNDLRGKRAQTQMQELVQQRTQLDEQLIDAPVPETEEQQQAQRSAEERLLDLSNRIAADTNGILQLEEAKFAVQRSVAKLEGELEHVQNAVAQIERERAARQQQGEDEDSPVTALQADLEAAERRVAELVETNDVLRQSLKGLTIECEER